MKTVCVVIPIHLSVPSDEELVSFKQCVSLLCCYDIFIVAPIGLNINIYSTIYPNVQVKFIPKNWLSSVKAYNKMKIDKSFYQLFSDFKYMLTHELDAYIFKDDLSKWCNLAYDYIGAPWFSGYDKPIKTDHVIGVGNSGLSLRNIQTCLAVLNCLNRFNLKGKLYSSQFSKQTFRLLTFLSSKLPVTQAKFYVVRAYLRNEYVHEDIFWCKFVPILFPDFKISSVQDALHFSFDASPRKCFNLNGGVLPFGCHAWHRFDPEFWDQFIPNKQNSRDTL